MIKISYNEANKRLIKKHSNNIIMLNYINMNNKASFVCNKCGYKWDIEAKNVINAGTGCENCYKKNKKENHFGKLSDEYVRKYIESFNCLWVSGEYKNNRSFLKISFSCGCSNEISFGNFVNGRRCYIHQREKAAKKRRISLLTIINHVKEYGFIFAGVIGDNSGRKTRFSYICKFGHKTERYYKDFINHPNCRTCEIEKRKIRYVSTPNEINDKINKKGCSLIKIESYKNNKNSNLIIEFSCGHRETLSMTNFQGRKTGLCVECELERRSGKTSYRWKGGFTPLTLYIRRKNKDWNKYCANFYGYRCIITNKPMEHIHHLQSFNLLLEETIKELDVKMKKSISNYLSEELNIIIDKFLEVQLRYPIGVPISTKVHHCFHNYYGRGNNTPEQFYEFQSRIQSGEIQIPQ